MAGAVLAYSAVGYSARDWILNTSNEPTCTSKVLSRSAALPNARLLLNAPSFSDPGAVRLFTERLQKLGVGRSSPHPRHGGRAAGDGELTLVTASVAWQSMTSECMDCASLISPKCQIQCRLYGNQLIRTSAMDG
jgi:hypothetical protein